MINEILDLDSGISLVYGEGGTGKTTLALMLAYNYSKFSKVIFIDTENGFNFERFKQISQDNYKNCLKNILLFKIKDFNEQFKIIKNLENIGNISLVVIDTIGFYYRLELKNDFKFANNKMSDILKILNLLSKKNVKIFLTNQVYNNFNTNNLESVGGNLIKKFCNFIIKLEKNPRKIVMENTKIEYSFEIKNEGVKLI
jgi:RecA/RadA recombinase